MKFTKEQRVVMRDWISVYDRLPEPEQAVLAAVDGLGAPIVLELRWETCNPMTEPYYEDFFFCIGMTPITMGKILKIELVTGCLAQICRN